MTSGERRFARRLESHLEQDYLCWYDVPVGPKRQHPDFVVLHPSRGLLILEVKDWKIDFIQRIDRQSVTLLTTDGVKETINPLEQARQYAHAVIRPMQRDPALIHTEEHRYAGRLIMPFGYGVVLSRITRRQFDASDLGEVLPPERVICQDEMTESEDMEVFQTRLWDMFTVYFDHRLDLPQIDRIRWHLFPEVRISQGSLFESEAPDEETEDVLPDILRVMDLQQEQLARSMGEGHRVVHGAAGAGKTLILVYRCLHLAQVLRKPILVLCYNRTLARRIQTLLVDKGIDEARVHVRGFHSWCHSQLRTYNLALPPRGRSREGFYDGMVQRVIEGVEREDIPAGQYGAVLVDEGHDFQPHWLKLVVQMVDPKTHSLLVLYDDAQSIYRRGESFSFSSVGIQARGRTTILRINYRNTQEILDLATKFARDLLTAEQADEDGIPLVVPETAGRGGSQPLVVELPDWREELAYMARHLRELHESGIAWRDMAVLHRRTKSARPIADALEAAGIPQESLATKSKRSAFDANTETVKVLTMHSSKGLEFRAVAIPGINRMPREEEDPTEEARVLYVGMTRAMDHLLVTGHAAGGFLDQLRAAG
ncbi:MAG: NERD domain-containing protein/DEAD/DEAH box helicase [Halofilum sp. (in: g-proteobacteria)]|nr:NERD domain-containing protein/DEAD/DEAH box helicase [Halofilum sp. (in: g-proteobacteria)]